MRWRIYRRGDNPRTDEPIRVVVFVFTERVTEIPVTYGQEEQKDEENPNEQDDRDDSSEQATEPDEEKHGYWKRTGRQHFYCDPSDSKTAHQGDYASEWKMDNSASATEFTCSGSVEGNYWSGGR